MTDANKSTQSWSFSQPATSGSSGSLFVQANSSTSKPAGSIFGATTTPSAASGPTLFGNQSTGGGSSFFGGGTGGMTPATAPGGGSGSTMFGGENKQGAGFFGQAGSQNNQMGAPNTFPAFSTPNKPAESSSAGQNQAPSLFGGSTAANSTGNPFANLGKTSNEQTNTTTPTSKPAISLFGNSTTPAGPPPTGSSQGSSLFGKPENPFGTLSPNPAQGGFNFGKSKPLESPAPASTQASNPFPSSTGNASDLFGKRPAPSDGGLFPDANKAQNTGENKSVTPQQQQNDASALPNPFAPNSQASTSASPAQIAPSLFSPAKSIQPEASTTKSTSSPAATSGGFNFLSKPASSGTTVPSTNAPSLFANLGKPQDKASASSAESTGALAPSSSASAPASSLFGNMTKPAALASTTAETTAQASGLLGSKPAASLGASTAGPAPAPQSRLKNKSMDDIISRWATDLSKYQKEFQQQAEKVATWDRMLVENSEKIQKLYGNTLEAERATTEVERQLTAVESDQEELSHWLDYYEKQVDLMISSTIGQDGAISGPDQERERTYQLASRLSERLDEMGKDLSSMIEEINDASSTLNKHNKGDDPLSQVVKVLNSHLTQLQQIDQGTAALQLKVQAAQRASQTLGPLSGLSGPNSNAADGFYRSFMGRR